MFVFRYSEIDYYNWTTHATNVPEKAIGHFTQVVWKNSANVGMAIATATKSDWIYTFIVARYTPAGNYIGQYGSNVKEVIAPGNISNCCHILTRQYRKRRAKISADVYY